MPSLLPFCIKTTTHLNGGGICEYFCLCVSHHCLLQLCFDIKCVFVTRGNTAPWTFVLLFHSIILGKCSALWGKRERVVWSIGVMLLHDPS